MDRRKHRLYEKRDLPDFLYNFLTYIETIKGQSDNTVKEYFYDLRTFFRFVKLQNDNSINES